MSESFDGCDSTTNQHVNIVNKCAERATSKDCRCFYDNICLKTPQLDFRIRIRIIRIRLTLSGIITVGNIQANYKNLRIISELYIVQI